MERHLRGLMSKHRQIDQEIERERQRPSAAVRVHALKRLRLALKDRIAALQRRAARQGA